MALEQHRREDGRQFELKNVVVTTVQPAEKTAHAEKHDIALFDMYLLDFYLPILMLFRPDRSREDQKTLNASEFVTRIKQSLSRILVPYYTFAGRSRKTYDLKIRELLCKDEGVPFIEAEIDEDMENVVNIDDFQPLSILSGYEFVCLDPVDYYHDHGDFPLPAAFIQATKFKCGGVSVNVSFLHMVGDGKAMFQFLKEWSQMTLDDQISFEPIHDRSLTYPISILLDMMAAGSEPPTVSENLENLVHRENSQFGKNCDEALPIQDRVHDQLDELNISVDKEGSNGSTLAAPRPSFTSTTGSADCNAEDSEDLAAGLRFLRLSEWKRKTLHVRRECVEKLKKVAKDKNDGFEPTVLDCIHSYLWRGLSRAPSSVDGRKSTILGIVAEGRRRLHEIPLPDSYSGNDFVLFYTQPIEQPSDDPLVEALVVDEMVHTLTPQTWLPLFARAVHVLSHSSTIDERNMFVTSWYRFPMYEVDFGYGKPIFATANSVSSTPATGYAIIMPPRPGSDYQATIQLIMLPEILEAMLNDSEFRSFFH